MSKKPINVDLKSRAQREKDKQKPPEGVVPMQISFQEYETLLNIFGRYEGHSEGKTAALHGSVCCGCGRKQMFTSHCSECGVTYCPKCAAYRHVGCKK